MRRLRTFACARGGLLGLAALVVYAWAAPTQIVDGDNAELSTLGAVGGAAHPPGYPLYVLYLRAMSWLPGATPAHTAALATAILGAAAIVALHAACRAWGASAAAASLAAAIVAGSPIVLRLHTQAEVFALNHLLVALVLWLAAPGGPARGARRTLALAFVAGLGLANHHTCVLVAPVGIYGAIVGLREVAARRAAIAVGSLLALALGLAPYAYLVADSPASWGAATSLADIVAHFTRQDYGGPGAFSPVPGRVDPLANLAAFAGSFGRAWWWGPAAVGLVALGALAIRARADAAGVRRATPSRAAWLALAASWLVTAALIARFDIAPARDGLYIVERFHVLPIVIFAIPVAAGLDRCAGWLASRFGPARAPRPVVSAAVALAVFLAAAGASLPRLLLTHSPAVEHGALNLLRSLPEGAVVIVSADDLSFGTMYAQEARGIRRDVVVVSWMMTTLPWYRARLAARGVTVDPYAPGEGPPSVRVARQVLGQQRPLFVELSHGNILARFPSYPHGLVFRVLPEGTQVPPLDDILSLNQDLFAVFDLAYPRPVEAAAYAVTMHVRYLRTWEILAEALARAGRRDDARAASAVARDLAPAP